MAKYLMISISVLAKIILIQGFFYKNIKVSTRLDLSGSLNRLCGVDESNDEDDLATCDCLARLSVSSTVQAGKYHHVANYNENNSAALTGYASIHQTEPDLYLGGRSRLKFNNAKCVKNGETKELKSRTTQVFHVSSQFSTGTVPNDYFTYVVNDVNLVAKTKIDINSENARPFNKLKLEVNNTVLYEFDKDLGTMCGESLKKGSVEESLWSIFNFTYLHGNGCNFPKDHEFEPTINVPLAVTFDEPLQCGDYQLYFRINTGESYLYWYGYIWWNLYPGSNCV
ncbi:uncharacterized protein LOC130674395 [Microplitis mediator]|uniref:uncharacterized protein LOC130674395 n=1 Tax=Microplitis mediator TaxID=375433 RepID=UPI00255723C5|nr:uncharacterized protein LOC130674395 [Microplitis mediator]